MYVICNYVVKTEIRWDIMLAAVNSGGWKVCVRNLIFVRD